MTIDPTISSSAVGTLKKQVKKDLERHEGYREFAYPDPLSPLHKKNPQLPWGQRPARELAPPGTDWESGSPWTVGFGFTHGVGPDSKMPRIQAERKLEEHILQADLELSGILPWYKSSPFVVKTVLINMRFNLGRKGLLGFKNTLGYMKERQWTNASANMRKSLWYRQVGQRAEELARRIETQEIPRQYKA